MRSIGSLVDRRGAWACTALALMGLLLGACAGRRAATACAPECPPVADCAPATEGPPCPPPEARVNEAWCRVWVPPSYRTVVEQVCVKPASKRREWIPPEYGVRPRIVCESPARLDQRVQPGLWRAQERDVLLRPAREGWQRACCPTTCDPCSGEVVADCWTKYRCPPVWGKEQRPVCVYPPTHCLNYTPAKYKCVEERFLVRAGFWQEICDPAQYETRTREECVCPGRWIWQRRTDCEIPEELLPALEIEMSDKAEDGTEEGTFQVGDIVRYDLEVRSDEASQSMPSLKVVFVLPAELEFVSGEGQGVTIEGNEQRAETSAFPLGLGESVRMSVLARVRQVPETGLVQLEASIQMRDGTELAVETESTTLY